MVQYEYFSSEHLAQITMCYYLPLDFLTDMLYNIYTTWRTPDWRILCLI